MSLSKKPLPRKPDERPKPDPASFKARKEVPAAQDLYSVGPIPGFTPITQFYGYNLDFSTFPLLVERIYRDMLSVDERLSRKMPFTMFLHSMTTLLNGTLIDLKVHENKESGFMSEGEIRSFMDHVVPAPIAEYFSLITQTTTQAGDVIRCNIPDAAIPKKGGQNGTFGNVTAASHNLYECYISPAVTRARLEVTIANDRNWKPLPERMFPEGYQPTVNLLGYGPIDALNPEGRNAVSGLTFPTQDDIVTPHKASNRLHINISYKYSFNKFPVWKTSKNG